MRKAALFLSFVILAGAILTCSDKSSNPGRGQIGANLRQIGGCISGVLQKSAVADSSFGYQFGDTSLSISF